MTAQTTARASFEPGTLVGGKYRIISLIGIGGVGRVYLARHIELETDVAIKVLRPEVIDRPEVVQRFAREARTSVRLHSPRIASVLDVGNHEGKPYFVMEYMVGCNLLEARQQPDIDIATLCEFFIQACEGLADAHAQGVVHRDVKPENLFVARDASGWRSLKIFDFGISKFSLTGRYSDVDLASMRTEAMMGTPHYISPEQIRSTRDVDHRTDIWSLGAVMFEVLSGGILPFREEREVTALVAEVLEQPHRSLLDVAPNVPERLAAIVNRCLVKDRTLRYQTVAEVALDLLPLAPARARASAERAVSVMQAAGFIALNGDMESLRPSHPPIADASVPSYSPRSGSSRDDTLPGAPVSGPRPSDSARAIAMSADTVQTISASPPRPIVGTPPPISRRPSAAPSAPPGAASQAPASSLASVSAVSLAAADSSVTPLLDEDFPPDDPPPDQARGRRRKAAFVLALIGLTLVGTAVALSMQSEPEPPHVAPPRATPSPLEAEAIAVRSAPLPESAAPSASQALPLPAESAASAASAALSAVRKAAPPAPRVNWSPRPTAAPPAPKSAPPKAADLPSPTPRPELRRER